MFVVLLAVAALAFGVSVVVEALTFLHGMLLAKLDLRPYQSRSSSRNWALVTGASDGIGWAFVKKLADLGFNVILHGRNPEKLQDCVQKAKAAYPDVDFAIVVAEAGDCSDANVRKLLQACQDRDLAILVNNVGIAQHQKMLPLEHLDYDDITDTVNVNCLFTAVATNILLPKLLADANSFQHRCAIINIASVVAFGAFPGFTVYAATKAFIHSFSQSLAAELATDGRIDVVCTSPGYTESNLTQERPSWLVSSAESVVENTLRRIRYQDIVPGYIAMATYCSIASLMLVPSLLRARIVSVASRFAPKPRGLKHD